MEKTKKQNILKQVRESNNIYVKLLPITLTMLVATIVGISTISIMSGNMIVIILTHLIILVGVVYMIQPLL